MNQSEKVCATKFCMRLKLERKIYHKFHIEINVMLLSMLNERKKTNETFEKPLLKLFLYFHVCETDVWFFLIFPLFLFTFLLTVCETC